MKLGTYTQQPAERESYTIDYSLDLTAGDNIESVVSAVAPLGLVVDTITNLDPRVRFWLSGGTNGVTYKITLTTTTADGRILQDEVTVKIKEI